MARSIILPDGSAISEIDLAPLLTFMANQVLRDDLTSNYGVDLSQNISTPGTPTTKRRKLSPSVRSDRKSNQTSSAVKNSRRDKLQFSFNSAAASPVLYGGKSNRKRDYRKLTSPPVVKRSLSLSVNSSKLLTPDHKQFSDSLNPILPNKTTSSVVDIQEVFSEDIFANTQFDTPPSFKINGHGGNKSSPSSDKDAKTSLDESGELVNASSNSLVNSLGEVGLDKSPSSSNKETKTTTTDKGDEVVNSSSNSLIWSFMGEEPMLMNDTMTFSMMERLAQDATTEKSITTRNTSSEDVFSSQTRSSTSFIESRSVTNDF